MSKHKFFWETMKLCNWNCEGDDNKVLLPVIEYLSKQEENSIFEFDDSMSELLYHLDTKKLAEQCRELDRYMSDDSFLYSRCVALINGAGYYKEAVKGKRKEMWSMEFEALLYVPAKAWALKHKKDTEEYPHFTPFCYETGSNKEGWE